MFTEYRVSGCQLCISLQRWKRVSPCLLPYFVSNVMSCVPAIDNLLQGHLTFSQLSKRYLCGLGILLNRLMPHVLDHAGGVEVKFIKLGYFQF